MRATNKRVVLKTVGDLHFDHIAPAYRSKEPDWYAAMQRMTDQLWELDKKYPGPWVYPGDIFNEGWRPHRCPPELINWVGKHLPKGYAIPGQHDLPHHRYDDKHKSAYHTLCEMGVIIDLPPNTCTRVGGKDDFGNPWGEQINLWGYPWGNEVGPLLNQSYKGPNDLMNVAVIHACCWMNNYGYEGAPPRQLVTNWMHNLEGYDVALFNDNHKGFVFESRSDLHPNVLNNGTFMVRKAEDRSFPPKVGLVYDDGSVGQITLDTSKDVYCEGTAEEEPAAFDASTVIEELEKYAHKGIDFHQTLLRAISSDKVRPEVEELIQKIMAEET